jgi:hypothetical protein
MPLDEAELARRIPVRQPLWRAPCIDQQQRIAQRFSDHYTFEITTPAQRALISQWVLFANSTLPIALFVPFRREPEFPPLMKVLNHQLDPEAQAHLGDLPVFP